MRSGQRGFVETAGWQRNAGEAANIGKPMHRSLARFLGVRTTCRRFLCRSFPALVFAFQYRGRQSSAMRNLAIIASRVLDVSFTTAVTVARQIGQRLDSPSGVRDAGSILAQPGHRFSGPLPGVQSRGAICPTPASFLPDSLHPTILTGGKQGNRCRRLSRTSPVRFRRTLTSPISR